MATNNRRTRRSTTAAETPKALHRNLDPMTFPIGAFRLRVIAANSLGPCENGARLVSLKGKGAAEKSVPVAALRELLTDPDKAERFLSAVDDLEQRAHIGAYRVAADNAADAEAETGDVVVL